MNVAKQMQEIVLATLVFHTTVLCLRAYFVHMFFFQTNGFHTQKYNMKHAYHPHRMIMRNFELV